jgi:hypothetical protein
MTGRFPGLEWFVHNWAKNVAGRVKGDVEVFDLNPFNGSIRMLQREVIFPVPELSRVTRGLHT